MRKILNVFAWLSFALAGASAAIWFRSHRVGAETWIWTNGRGGIREIALDPGEMRLAITHGVRLRQEFEHITGAPKNRLLFSPRWLGVWQARGFGTFTYTESILIDGF